MANAPKQPQLRLDHAAIWVEDMEKTVGFLTDVVGWRRHPMDIMVSDEDETTGGMEAVFVDANGLWLEMILPTSPGPGMDILKEKGDGAIIEINFEPDDYDAVLQDMKVKGIPMFNMDGSPLGEDGGLIKEGVVEEGDFEHTGQRIAYWSTELSRGTTVEIFEVIKDNATNLINQRDAQWEEVALHQQGPRMSHISIVVADLESTASFYTDVMGLKRHPMQLVIDAATNEEIGGMKAAFIDAGGVWLELFQPVGPGPLMDLLNEKGDGYVAELCTEVDDLAAYYDSMKAKGVQMVGIDGTPLDDSEKYYVLDPYGDKIAYFPAEVSRGLTVEVIERGPRETSILHRRDDTWKD